MTDLLTVKAAAHRVKRSTRQIERWIADGLPVTRIGNTRYIRIDHLLAELRTRNLNDPAKARQPGTEARRAHRVRKHLERAYTPET